MAVQRSHAILMLGFVAAMSACAAKQSGSAKPSGFLREYGQLREGKEGEALLVYVKPGVDLRPYSKVVIDPVTIWDDPQTAKIPSDEAQLLADDLDDALRIALAENFTVVEAPGPGVLRVRAAITEAEGSWHVEDHILGRFDTLHPPEDDEPSTETRNFVGRAGVEGEVLDSVTGERLLAAVDRRAGARTLATKKTSWQDVEDAFEHWAERLRVRLVALKGGE